ncbi:Dabb family protein [Gordonia sp. (in: high G+C Gram-positive bacteria)]|uniref:Dabb family protein n=1 Tax=Gordonia sp. (in: high G+C Gram-positive bacteria) TaxID=84139 RepID=UPI0016A92A6C|nr:Dabb family protein [Gordonia sp. (in: high G+C Gram-positive bacteria)]NLG48007.1 Dabb family protein [Gordonia sp. (in: high G+C Gram-positive bacteria)]
MSDLLSTHLLTAGRHRDPAALAESLRVAVGPAGGVIGRTLPGAINGGDVLLHGPSTTVDAAMSRERFASVESVRYRPGATGHRGDPTEALVYRALLLGIGDDASDQARCRFERDLLLMPRHITSMVWWRLSHVESSHGPTRFTHVWEQLFRTREALSGQYMNHPVHWGLVDRWFDPEMPENLGIARLCHVACDFSPDQAPALGIPALDVPALSRAHSIL